jgi:hypothetical protein
MDKYQHWQGIYYKLDQIGTFLKTRPDAEFESNTKLMELTATWSLAKLMQSRNKKEYAVGFPVASDVGTAPLDLVISGDIPTFDEDVDTVMTEVPEPLEGIPPWHPIQVKRYFPRGSDTDTFTKWLLDKIDHYAPDPVLTLLIWISGYLNIDWEHVGKVFGSRDYPMGGLYIVTSRIKDEKYTLAIHKIYPSEDENIWGFRPV